MKETILTTNNLTKSYKKRKVVDRLNLEVNEGDVYGFLGPNGAGKSTTIRMIFELVYPDEGEVKLFGKSLHKNRYDALKNVCGIVEKPDFYLYLSAYKNLEIISSMNGKISKNNILQKLEIVGLMDRAFDKVKAYSHGMKQRLAIALALVTEPKLIILDEPTNGLDPQGMKEVRDLILKLNSEKGMTIFLSSHLLHEVEQVATRMAIINQGKLIEQGYVNELLNLNEGKFFFCIKDIAKAIELVNTNFPGFEKSTVSDGIEIYLKNEQVPEVNRFFVQNGISVFSIIPKRSLEEYFLSLTEGGEKK